MCSYKIPGTLRTHAALHVGDPVLSLFFGFIESVIYLGIDPVYIDIFLVDQCNTDGTLYSLKFSDLHGIKIGKEFFKQLLCTYISLTSY